MLQHVSHRHMHSCAHVWASTHASSTTVLQHAAPDQNCSGRQEGGRATEALDSAGSRPPASRSSADGHSSSWASRPAGGLSAAAGCCCAVLARACCRWVALVRACCRCCACTPRWDDLPAPLITKLSCCCRSNKQLAHVTW